jgi:hypothetical protein
VVAPLAGTLDTVGQAATTPVIVAGLLTVLLFWARAACGTYTLSE